jgi:predicted GIY-YIG superfamily endonuclease
VAWVYILLCADGSLYVGATTDLARRLVRHREGTGAGYTTTRRPVRLVCSEEQASVRAALVRERQLKRWRREKKLALVAGDLERLKRL